MRKLPLRGKSDRSGLRSTFESLEPRRLLTVSLAQDLDPSNAGSLLKPRQSVGTTAFFTYSDPGYGKISQIWQTDGTLNGTSVAVTFPSVDSNSFQSAVAGNYFYYSLQVGAGRELWRLSSTTPGATRLAVFDNPISLVSAADVGGQLYFVNVEGGVLPKLWKSDGTPAGTVQVADHFQRITQIVSFNNQPFLAASDYSSTAIGLFKIVPGLSTPVRVKNIRSSGDSQVANLTVVSGKLFFTADDGVAGNELWVTDGTDSGTSLFKDFTPNGSSAISSLQALGSRLLLFAEKSGANDWTLWSLDGTPQGSQIVQQSIWSYASDFVSDFTLFDGKAVYVINTPSTGRELWHTDGTAAGTAVVDLTPGPASSDLGSTVTYMVVVNDRLLVFANGYLQSLTNTFSTPTFLAPFKHLFDFRRAGNGVVFSGDDGLHGSELWYSDGTVSQTYLVRDENLTPLSSNPNQFFALGSSLVFNASGWLWGFDGNSGVPLSQQDFPALPTTGYVVGDNDGTPVAARLGKFLYFANLFRTDATPSGSTLVKLLSPTGRLTASDFTAVNGQIFFSAQSNAFGHELYVTDGTPAGTYLLKDIAPGTDSSNPRNITSVNGIAYFTAAGRLYKSDGTSAGTQIVAPALDVTSGAHHFAALGSSLLFSLAGTLYKSDGTAAGTTIVVPPSTVSVLSDFVILSNAAYFLGKDSAGNYGLWKTGGASGTTTLIKSFASSVPVNLVLVRNTLYFTVDGITLWKSDGATASAVKTLAANPPEPISRLTASNGMLYFRAYDPATGVELWQSDGTLTGTVVAGDLNPGTASSNPDNLTNVNGVLYFSATDPGHGTELFKAVTTYTTPAAASSVQASALSGSEIAISWADNSFNETGFVVERSATSSFTSIAASFTTEPNIRRFVDQGLAPGSTAYYRVRAVNQAGSSAASAVVSASTPAAPLFPIALTADNTTSGIITLRWTDQATNETSYLVERSPSPNFTSIQASVTLPANSTSFTDTTTTPANAYYYRVTARNAAGNSQTAAIVVDTPEAAPANFVAVGIGSSRIYLSWTDLGVAESGYAIQRAQPGQSFLTIATLPPNSTDYTDFFSSAPASDFVYRVTAQSPMGDGVSPLVHASLPLDEQTHIIQPTTGPDDRQANLVKLNDTAYFTVGGTSSGAGPIYKSDGTPEHTSLLYNGPADHLFVIENTLYFSSYDSATGRELYKSDGTLQDPTRITDVLAGPTDSDPRPLAALGSTLIFAARNSTGKYDLWAIQSSSSATLLAANLFDSTTLPSPSETPAVVNGCYVFAASNATGDREVWRTDGTMNGTFQVKNLNAAGSANPINFAVFNSAVYFVALADQYSVSLWKTDGSSGNATLVKDLNDPTSISDYHLTSVGGKLYFVESDPTNGTRIWTSDGTPTGTKPILAQSLPLATLLSQFVTFHGNVYFVAQIPVAQGTKVYLYATDGTASGTRRITQLAYAVAPVQLAATAQSLFISDGRWLWRSDGTVQGTIQASTLNFWLSNVNALPLLPLSDRIIFTGSGPNVSLAMVLNSPPVSASEILVSSAPSHKPAPAPKAAAKPPRRFSVTRVLHR